MKNREVEKEEEKLEEEAPEERRKKRRGEKQERRDKCEELKKAKRTKLVQIKVAPNLKKKAEQRAAALDMGLSEYVRFLLYCDIHGYAPTGDSVALAREEE